MGGAATDLRAFTGVGTVLGGKYQVERVVGSGGMGVVVVARHLRLGSQVAVKFMLPRPNLTGRRDARFMREARTASRITSPHVARVFDVDLREDGVPYIVMEFLEGETMASALGKAGRFSIEETINDLMSASEALAEAHTLGIAHRDLKPANLFRARIAAGSQYVLKVLDFGISKTFAEDTRDPATATTADGFVGSPPYMSPEQLTTPTDVDAVTDIWSLGVVLYECLTGSSPFAAETVIATCTRILHEEPPAPSSLAPGVPAELDRVVARCLAKSKADRYPSIAEVARDLAPFGNDAARRSLDVIDSLGGSAPPLLPEIEAVAEPAGSTLSALDAAPFDARAATPRPRRTVRNLVVLGTALFVIGVALASLRGSAGRDDELRSTSPSEMPPAATRPRPQATPAAPATPLVAPAPPSAATEAAKRLHAASRVPRRPPSKGPTAARSADRPSEPTAKETPPPAAPPRASTDPEAIFVDRE